MKSCPACQETYSERIDFCFNDGEVLVLLPSAMDAPMPRLAGIPAGVPSGSGAGASGGQPAGAAPAPRASGTGTIPARRPAVRDPAENYQTPGTGHQAPAGGRGNADGAHAPPGGANTAPSDLPDRRAEGRTGARLSEEAPTAHHTAPPTRSEDAPDRPATASQLPSAVAVGAAAVTAAVAGVRSNAEAAANEPIDDDADDETYVRDRSAKAEDAPAGANSRGAATPNHVASAAGTPSEAGGNLVGLTGAPGPTGGPATAASTPGGADAQPRGAAAQGFGSAAAAVPNQAAASTGAIPGGANHPGRDAAVGADKVAATSAEKPPVGPAQRGGKTSPVSWFVGFAAIAIAAVVLFFTVQGQRSAPEPGRASSAETKRAETDKPGDRLPPAGAAPVNNGAAQIAPVGQAAPLPGEPAIGAAPAGTVPPPGLVPGAPGLAAPGAPVGTVVTAPAAQPSTKPPVPGAPSAADPTKANGQPGQPATPTQTPGLVAPTQPGAAGNPWDAPVAASSGKVVITSDPSGASIRVDGKSRGVTPLELELPYGTYSVELDMNGFTPVRKRIDVQSPAPKFPYTLQREVRRGNVLVVFEGWDGATLEVDGELKGQLPSTIILSEGAHSFVVRGDRGEVRLRREVELLPTGLTKLFLHQ